MAIELKESITGTNVYDGGVLIATFFSVKFDITGIIAARKAFPCSSEEVIPAYSLVMVKVNTLTGMALDAAVAKSCGYTIQLPNNGYPATMINSNDLYKPTVNLSDYSPSTNWSQAGDIIQMMIVLGLPVNEIINKHGSLALTYLMRCYVSAMNGGDEIMMPDSLIK